MARKGADGMAQSEARDRAPLHLHLFLSCSLFAAGVDGAARCRGDGKGRQGRAGKARGNGTPSRAKPSVAAEGQGAALPARAARAGAKRA